MTLVKNFGPLDFQGGILLNVKPRGPAKTNKSKMTAEAVFSTDAIDRVGDRVRIPGIFTGHHRANPIVLWNHNRDAPLGRTEDQGGNYTVVLGETEATQVTYFSQKSSLAEQIFDLIVEGTIRANSWGFNAIKSQPLYVQGRRLGLDLIETELHEVTWCAIGCNPEAIRRTLAREHVCGRQLDEVIRKDLQPFAERPRIWAHGADLVAMLKSDGAASPVRGEEADRLDVMAEILGGLLERQRQTKTKAWEESKHPRAQDGKFGSGAGSAKKPAGNVKPSKPSPKKPGSKPALTPSPSPQTEKPARAARAGSKEAQAAASKAIEKITSGAITESSHKELVGHLSRLTVPQLKELQQQHGLKASPKLKAQIIDRLSTHFNSKIVKQGSVSVDAVANALKPFESVKLDLNETRFAKADYLAIKEHYGSLAVHRIKDLAVDALKAMRDLPKGSEEQETHRRKLGIYAWMAGQAKRDGIEGKVEPKDGKDLAASLDRITLSERLKGTPWTSFVIRAVAHQFEHDDNPKHPSHLSDEQIWNKLKQGDYSTPNNRPRLQAALKMLRPDYGTMSVENFQRILPLLKERRDTVTAIAGKVRVSKSLRKSWDEGKHPRAEDGKFGSGGGGGPTSGDSPQTAGGKAKAAMRAGVAKLATLGKKVGHLEHAATEQIGKQVARLPAPIRLPVVGMYKASMATYDVAQKAVAAVAKERGNTPEQVDRISKICSIVNVMGAKALPLTFSAAGIPGASLSGFAPLGSLGYLAFATATNPAATWRAAKKGVAAAMAKLKLTKAEGGATIADLLDSIGKAKDADAWMAHLLAAIDATGDVKKSLAIVGTSL